MISSDITGSLRRICVFTGSRAEYGLLSSLLHELSRDPNIVLQILASGMHLSPEFGCTYSAIEDDGFTIDAKVEMLLSSDTPVGTSKSMGVGIIGFADALDRLRPDLLVVLGDRYETLAVAQAALIMRIPVAHIAGGETTEGAIDESIRHAVTKMSHMHFVSIEIFRQRIIQMGEDPLSVHAVGALGLDNVRRIDLLDRRSLARKLGLGLQEPTFLVTYHPATLGKLEPVAAVQALLDALDEFPSATVLFTKPNADPAGRRVTSCLEAYSARHAGHAAVFPSLGQRIYLSALKHADVVIGNSSSALIEAPALQTPTVNLGDRQKGRPKAGSIIDCQESTEDIFRAIRTALSPSFLSRMGTVTSPFGDGKAARRIAKVLGSIDLDGITVKRFYDLPVDLIDDRGHSAIPAAFET